ncbi:hypothetical protein pb186bvf_019850 [Paramecium bursaria]
MKRSFVMDNPIKYYKNSREYYDPKVLISKNNEIILINKKQYFSKFFYVNDQAFAQAIPIRLQPKLQPEFGRFYLVMLSQFKLKEICLNKRNFRNQYQTQHFLSFSNK